MAINKTDFKYIYKKKWEKSNNNNRVAAYFDKSFNIVYYIPFNKPDQPFEMISLMEFLAGYSFSYHIDYKNKARKR